MIHAIAERESMESPNSAQLNITESQEDKRQYPEPMVESCARAVSDKELSEPSCWRK